MTGHPAYQTRSGVSCSDCRFFFNSLYPQWLSSGDVGNQLFLSCDQLLLSSLGCRCLLSAWGEMPSSSAALFCLRSAISIALSTRRRRTSEKYCGILKPSAGSGRPPSSIPGAPSAAASRSSGSIVLPAEKSAAASTVFCSSRMFPGQGCCRNQAMAPFERRLDWFWVSLNRSRNLSASRGISLRRWRRGGT